MPEVRYTITVDDKGSAVFNQFKSSLQQGGSDIKNSLNEASNAVKNHSSLTERLTALRKEEIKEARLQNFIMGQAKEVIGGVALGLTSLNLVSNDSSDSVKKLSNGLNEGFLAFQGLSFAMSAVPYGNAIAGVMGVVVAFNSLNRTSEESINKFKELREESVKLRYDLGELTKQQYLDKLTTKLAEAGMNIIEAKEASIDWFKMLTGIATFNQFAMSVDITALQSAENEYDKIRKVMYDILGINKSQTEEEKRQLEIKKALFNASNDLKISQIKLQRDVADNLATSTRERLRNEYDANRRIIEQQARGLDESLNNKTITDKEYLARQEILTNEMRSLDIRYNNDVKNLNDNLKSLQIDGEMQLLGVRKSAIQQFLEHVETSGKKRIQNEYNTQRAVLEIEDQKYRKSLEKETDVEKRKVLLANQDAKYQKEQRQIYENEQAALAIYAEEEEKKLSATLKEIRLVGLDTYYEQARERNKQEYDSEMEVLRKHEERINEMKGEFFNSSGALVYSVEEIAEQERKVQEAKQLLLKKYERQNTQISLRENEILVNALTDGFREVETELVNGMGKAFEDVFGEANSLLELFAKGVLDSMTRIAAEQASIAAVSGILSLIPGIGTFGSIYKGLGGIFHEGGTVPKAHDGAYINAPSNVEFPILVRGGETIRTEAQEKSLQESGGGTVVMNFSFGHGWDEQQVINAIQKRMRQLGVNDVNKVVTNKRAKIRG